jgi:hypothetical protein
MIRIRVITIIIIMLYKTFKTYKMLNSYNNTLKIKRFKIKKMILIKIYFNKTKLKTNYFILLENDFLLIKNNFKIVKICNNNINKYKISNKFHNNSDSKFIHNFYIYL